MNVKFDILPQTIIKTNIFFDTIYFIPQVVNENKRANSYPYIVIIIMIYIKTNKII